VTIDGDLGDPIFQIRMIIGDASTPYYISDDVLTYIYDGEGDVYKAAIKAVSYLIGFFSKKVDQEVGDVRVSYSQLLSNYRKLLDDLVSNPDMNGGNYAIHYIGGTMKDEVNRVKSSTKVVKPKAYIGMFSDLCEEYPVSSGSPYYLR